MDDIDLAKSLRGSLGGGATTRRVSSPTTTTTIAGTATGDSANGVVSVRIDGQGTGTGDDGSTEIATTANVREGDRVMVNLVGADGTGKSPVVTGVVGGADRQQGEIDGAVHTAMSAAQTADAASTAAGEAKTIAEATGQHVWDDESGLHVTETEREDYEQTPTGFARLMTSAGELLTRAVEGVEKLLRSDTASGTVYYDGECAPGAEDAEDHVVAAFTKDGAQIGRKGNAHVEMDFNSFKMVDKQGNEFFSADDLRDADGTATLKETFRGDGRTKRFTLSYYWTAIVSVTDSSHESASYDTRADIDSIIFTVAPENDAVVTVVYKTTSGMTKAYTMGQREIGSPAGPMSVAEGYDVTASGNYSHSEGYRTIASGRASHAEGNRTFATGNYSHGEGQNTTASGYASHAEGDGTKSYGSYSHAEGGEGTKASGGWAHAEGHNTTASGSASHAEGSGTTASDNSSHAEGYATTASKVGSHAEGTDTTASGSGAHAEGGGTTASNVGSHAEGVETVASGLYSHAEGENTIASGKEQHVEGRYNVEDTNNQYAHIIGNGTDDDHRSNAYTVDWDGNVNAAGVITGASVGDANGTLQQLRDSVSQVETLSPTAIASTGVTVHGIRAYRLGKLVMLFLQLSTNKAVANNEVLAQISGIPATKESIFVFLSNNSNDGLAVNMTTGLQLKAAGAARSGVGWVSATFVYFVG